MTALGFIFYFVGTLFVRFPQKYIKGLFTHFNEILEDWFAEPPLKKWFLIFVPIPNGWEKSF